jgi:hypothetical protein
MGALLSYPLQTQSLLLNGLGGAAAAVSTEVPRAQLIAAFPQATFANGYSAEDMRIGVAEENVRYAVDCTGVSADGFLGAITAQLDVFTVGSAVRTVSSSIFAMDRVGSVVTLRLGSAVYGYDYRFTLLITTIGGSVLTCVLPRITCRT